MVELLIGYQMILMPLSMKHVINLVILLVPRIPNVKWEDIGGLDLVKDEILDTIDMPLKHPELFNNGLKKKWDFILWSSRYW